MKRGQAPERNKAIYEEVEKLVDVGIIKEVHFHSWLFNPVMVERHDGRWRMCVDFKYLNKACPKDGYPLECLYGYPFKCFRDACKGYHQIKMAKEDEENTTFVTSQGIICYTKMPFRLKNAEATYQRLVDKAFHKNRLEPRSTFLGYKVNANGLKKINAILQNPKEMHKEKRLPVDYVSGNGVQTNEKINSRIAYVNTPKEKEELIMYLAAAKEAVSVVLMTERDEKQMSIYFVGRALQGPEINYTPMEKLMLALVNASKCLKRNFQAYTIIVNTDQPIKQILSNPKVTGILLKWSFELEEHDIYYRPRTSIKGQILADFIMEFLKDDPHDTAIEEEEAFLDP
uniref:Reverse transcriptase domain-containing protein n=1 Tax=Tanacetum cinerariifolium TaxID=118510 RepID=A0A6L2M5Q5_TANCI|nr:reverse transcriptase domain-containing protein [Tanacetum cinerariifolium]